MSFLFLFAGDLQTRQPQMHQVHFGIPGQDCYRFAAGEDSQRLVQFQGREYDQDFIADFALQLRLYFLRLQLTFFQKSSHTPLK